jgi:pimeloyl-ACP methyl ester carboxylesterase/DNA-binding CsgD family transcriptional regulator
MVWLLSKEKVPPRAAAHQGTNVPAGLGGAARPWYECPGQGGTGVTSRARQRIHYLRTADQVKLAWAEASSGPPLVKASNWLSHLEHEWESPVWGHWIRFLCEHFRLVRYDERGCGMSDWEVADLSNERRLEDLEAVVAAAAPPEPFVLLGISQGAAPCLEFAARHPGRVSHLVLYGAYARGWSERGDPDGARQFQAIADLARFGWGKDNPAFRQVFTSRFIPGATREQMDWFNELCRRTASPRMAADLMLARGTINAVSQLERIRTPTLVVHARGDEAIPVGEGRLIASRIAGAQFVELDSRNHILLEDEPAWARFRTVVLGFLERMAPAGDDAAFASLTPREMEILGLLTEGLTNAGIASRLSLSEKTVRNQVSRVFDKLGVSTRAQAIVFARDRGFRL